MVYFSLYSVSYIPVSFQRACTWYIKGELNRLNQHFMFIVTRYVTVMYSFSYFRLVSCHISVTDEDIKLTMTLLDIFKKSFQ